VTQQESPVRPSPRARSIEAAFELFEERGYDGTTVDQIAERAGVSRSTFFRMFASKEEVIFPDHADLHRRIQARLAAAGDDASILAVVEGARMVLDHFLAEGGLARARYRLTRTVPALRDREVAGMHGYQRLFRDYIRTWMQAGPGTELRSELMANAVVTAHNVVLRRWLRGLTKTPYDEFDTAIREVVELFDTSSKGDDETTVVVLRSGARIETVTTMIREALLAGERQ
jgi:AcrR family transcriptional regulator